MPLMADSSTNWSFHALAAAYGLAATPMIYCFGSLTLASNGRVNNAMYVCLLYSRSGAGKNGLPVGKNPMR